MIATTAPNAVTAVARSAVWRLAYRGRVAAGAINAATRSAPDFLIIGGHRCGTTSLHRHLAEHPDVRVSRVFKGAHYFDLNFDRDWNWYVAHFPVRRAGSEPGDRPVTGEASPYYLFHPDVAGRIRSRLPDVKLIALLRDPVARAWSDYHHERARGFETLPFEAAVERELGWLQAGSSPAPGTFDHQHRSYLARGIYLPQLQRFYRLFGPDQILVMESDTFRADPGAGLDRVCELLGIRPHPRRIPVERNGVRYGPMPGDVRAALQEFFRPHNEELFAFLGERWPWSA